MQTRPFCRPPRHPYVGTTSRGAQAPAVSATHNGIVAKGGQTPAFDVQTGSVEIGSRNATVTVPELQVKPPAENQVANNSVNAM